MWTVIPLSQLGTWDGHCIYKIKDGSRRCKLSAGGDTNVCRFGNRNELIAKISRGASLTRQEKIELARGLCCLRWHSTQDIAQEICERWARVPATVLVPLPPQQTEIKRLKRENEILADRLQSAKAMEKHYYESWLGTVSQLKCFKAEIKELKKTLENTRREEEVSEDGSEFLTTKFGVRRNRVLSKGAFSVPAATAETSIRVVPVKHTIMSMSKTPANTKIINSYSLEDSSCLPHALTPDPISSPKNANPASSTLRHIASSADELIGVKNGHANFNLAAPHLSPLTPFSAIITKSEEVKSPSNSDLNLNILSSSSCNVTTTLASAVPESLSEHDLRKTCPLEVSPPPFGGQFEKLLKEFLGIAIFFCWAGNLSFGQFTSLVLSTSLVLWSQAKRRNSLEIQLKCYAVKDVATEFEAVLATESEMARDDQLRLFRRDEKVRVRTTSPDDKKI